MSKNSVTLPEGVSIGTFKPVAYYDKHMDFIRVVTHDRSVTEHRINEFFTLHECNHRGVADPEFVGFTLKGVKKIFHEVGMPLSGVHTLTEIIDFLVKHQPASTMAATLKMMLKVTQQKADELVVDFQQAA